MAHLDDELARFEAELSAIDAPAKKPKSVAGDLDAELKRFEAEVSSVRPPPQQPSAPIPPPPVRAGIPPPPTPSAPHVMGPPPGLPMPGPPPMPMMPPAAGAAYPPARAAVPPQPTRSTSDVIAFANEQLEKNRTKKAVDKLERTKRKIVMRECGEERWKDMSLLEWPDNDFRLFVGNLGKEVSDETLRQTFGGSKYPSFNMARAVRDGSGQSKGYGFVSYADAEDYVRAMQDLNGKFVGSRPIQLKRSQWTKRQRTRR